MDTLPGEDPMENPPHAPLAGLDPADLLRQGAADDTLPGGNAGPFQPPAIEELTPWFPRFEILELIGQGGMGAVYKVRQKDLDRVVALKILPPAISETAGFSERFAREAKALAKLNHPGIVTIHEFGQQNGLYFILMEFVDGLNLAQLMRSGRISPREALAIVPQICDALQFAHDQGIVHRDIKPENILLDRLGRVKVADFGIAKVVAAVGEDPLRSGDTPVPTDATIAGKILGTPQYMAPEQIDHPSDVDHRADIYALGVVFYQMLTGELPGKDLQAPSNKVRIDVRLDEIVMRALEKEPERRYQTALGFRTMLDELPAASAPPALPQRGMMRRWWWMFLVMIPLGPLLGFTAAAVLTSVMPKTYETEATVELRFPNGGMTTSSFFGVQFEAIKSRDLLTLVSKELELSNKWGVDEETVIRILKGIVSTENIRGTDLISIKVRHTNAEDASGIAQAILRHYQRSYDGEVIIHENPQLPISPVSPNITLILVLGSVGGLVLSPLMALLLIPLLQKVFPEKIKDASGTKRSSAMAIVSILLVLALGLGSIGLTAAYFFNLTIFQRAGELHHSPQMEHLENASSEVSKTRGSKYSNYEPTAQPEVKVELQSDASQDAAAVKDDHPRNRLEIRRVSPDDVGAEVMTQEVTHDGQKVSSEEVRVGREVIVSDEHVQVAWIRSEEDEHVLNVTLNEEGGKRLSQATAGEPGKLRLAIVVDGRIHSTPVVQSQLGHHFQISGFKSLEALTDVLNGLPNSNPAGNARELFLRVMENDELTLDGTTISRPALAEALKTVLKEAKDAKVTIRGDSEVPYQKIVEVIDFCQSQGVWNLSFGTMDKSEDVIAPPASEHPPVSIAEDWLLTMDAGKLKDAYDAIAPAAAAQVLPAQWEAAIHAARKPLGAKISRTYKATQPLEKVPGLPDGECLVYQFVSEFEHKKEAVESVILIKVENAWKPAGYYIR
ncbi:MAG: protein kinase [Verrucomicrobiota bacterium]